LIISTLIGSVGVGLTLIEYFYVLMLGRIILGFTAGSFGTIAIRFIYEYVPVKNQSVCIGIFCVS
jgi:MFS family permease